MDPLAETEHLSELVERQLQILSSLKILATQQAECLGADDVELLLSLIARKQPLIEELLQIQMELTVFQGQDPEQRVWSDAAKRIRCKEMLASCEQIHQEIVCLESSALGELEAHRNAVAATAARLSRCNDGYHRLRD